MTSPAPHQEHRSALIDLRPLTQHPAFARLWIGNLLGGLGGQLTIMAVMLHMYALTGSDMAVAMIAFAGLLPMIVAGLYGGMLADFFDRRIVALSAASVTWVSTAMLALLAWTGGVNEWWLYALSIVNSAANSIVGATKSAMTPKLVGKELVPAAAALNGMTMGLMVMAGPALGGVLVALFSYPVTYTIDVILMLSLFLGLWTLPSLKPEGSAATPGLKSLRQGLAFLQGAPNIRMQYVMDIVAMTFGHPVAILPAVGVLVLGGGEITTGFLTAAIAIGTVLSSVFSGRLGAVRRQGVGIARAIQVFGVCTLLFGLTLLAARFGWFADGPIDAQHANVTLIVLACIFLAGTGAADNVSAVFRQTMMQQAVPDEFRGRLQGVFIVVVAGGPRVGALYYGTLATLFAHWVPAVAGGMIIVALIALLLRASTTFRAYDSLEPRP
ncbi:MFS transporter [Microbacterium sediminis]|uniref:MFS transporter n=1 Tax=Microbacterium sediminis TaxID=904291 RepID=A0A1B9NB98_9MICO|nr:MFS transporter [Microbacterium sediminis]OCG73866.1 MFS transporter [Microbacterium sediminis]QBR74613.1 MFS transporter [Microbacterium sediminis]